LGDISSRATPKPWWSLLYSTIVLYDYRVPNALQLNFAFKITVIVEFNITRSTIFTAVDKVVKELHSVN